MKKIVIYTLVFLSLLSCKKKEVMNKDILNSDNYVDIMLNSIKHYDYEPVYWIKVDMVGEYEIYINDIPIRKYYDTENFYLGGTSINFVILKSGEQKLKYKIFSKDKEVFTKISIVLLDKKGSQSHLAEKKIKTIEKTIKMPSSGIYEGEFTFTAEVPYENKGWSDGQDLTQFDKKELETAVVNFYKKMWNIYNDKKNPDQLFPYIEQKDKELVQSLFQDEYEIKENLKAHLRPFVNPTYQLQPLENYKMTLYGDGKIVALEQTSMDIRLRGRLALWAKFSFEGEKSIKTSFPHLYLYLPKGKNLQDGLQIIR